MNDFEIAKAAINKFLDLEKEKIKTDKIDYLLNFNFSGIWNYDYRYRSFRGSKDEDSLWIVKYINFIVYQSVLAFSTIEEMNDKYNGETINTYSTLFESKTYNLKNIFNDTPSQKEQELIDEFKNKYLTIGNFMLLPKTTINNKSLNQIKGFPYADYPHYLDLADKFFIDLFDKNKKLYEFTEKLNLNTENFCKQNFLKMYFNENYQPKEVFSYKDFNSDLKTFTIDYMKKSIDIINYRAKKIKEVLKQKMFI